MLSSESFACGTMCTLHVGSWSVWCNLSNIVAITRSLNAQLKLVMDCIPVATVGFDGLNALTDDPVSLMAKGMVLSSIPRHRLMCGLVNGLLMVAFHHHELSLSVWLCGSTNLTQ